MAYKGKIDILQAPKSVVSAVAPRGTVSVLNEPAVTSDPCGGTGIDRAFVEWKSTDYCFSLPAGSGLGAIVTSLVATINNDVTGLSATGDGNNNITITSDDVSATDNGENVILKVTSAVDPDGDVFGKYTITLAGGVDGETASNESINININGSTFASFTLTNGDSRSDVATNIKNACDAIGSGTYTFTKVGTSVEVTTTSTFATLSLSTPSSLRLLWNSVDVNEI